MTFAEIQPWMTVIAFTLSSIWVASKIVHLARRPTLDVRLTKEIFFRLTDSGEGLFANAVLIARRGPIEIREIELELRKTTGSEKRHRLESIRFGEKTKRDSPIADHLFMSQSPKDLLPQDTARRAVYMAVFADYQSEIQGLFSSFQNAVRPLRGQFLEEVEADGTLPAQTARELHLAVSQSQRDATHGLLERIQLEPGRFELHIEITFRRLGTILRRDYKAKSAIQLEVDTDIKQAYRWRLESWLDTMSSNLILGQDGVAELPQYEPNNVSEL